MPTGRVISVPDGRDIKAGWRWATDADVQAALHASELPPGERRQREFDERQARDQREFDAMIARAKAKAARS